jgi:hypothetical protein
MSFLGVAWHGLAAAEIAPSPATVTKDREFLDKLEKVETNTQPTPPVVPASPAPSAAAPVRKAKDPEGAKARRMPAEADAEATQDPTRERPTLRRETPSEASVPEVAVRKSETSDGAKTRSIEKQEAATNRKPGVATRRSDSTVSRQQAPDRGESRSPTRVETQTAAGTAPALDSEIDRDPLEPQGVRIIRSTTTTKGPDGRTYVTEKTTTYRGTPAPMVRRVEPVERRVEPVASPRKHESFFDLLFKDNKDD